MGSPTTEAGRQADREDEHNVTLTQGFYLGKYEVTQAQYEAVMTGIATDCTTPSKMLPNNPNRPVEKVSWEDAQIFDSLQCPAIRKHTSRLGLCFAHRVAIHMPAGQVQRRFIRGGMTLMQHGLITRSVV